MEGKIWSVLKAYIANAGCKWIVFTREARLMDHKSRDCGSLADVVIQI